MKSELSWIGIQKEREDIDQRGGGEQARKSRKQAITYVNTTQKQRLLNLDFPEPHFIRKTNFT